VTRKPIIPSNYRFVYPEFLPDPKVEWRNPIREKLERLDMLDRRKQIDLPEFYVGSVLAVTSSDPHAAGKTSRFVGICINRDRCGLRARFILRNVIDHQGMEVVYELYDPTIQKVEVLRLEKRLDDNLLLIGAGITLYECLAAADQLEKKCITVRVIDPFTVKPLDAELIIEHGKQCGGRVVVVEDHYQ